jgi:hypothetical protein
MIRRDYIPTDTMQRRVPLSVGRRFLLFGTSVLIGTTHELLLRAAEAAGFMASADTTIPEMQWEIVGFRTGSLAADWECHVTLGDHSLYLSMGPEQWFAFDLETHHGAGFVTIIDSDPNHENARHYFSSIACHVGATLPGKLERSLL